MKYFITIFASGLGTGFLPWASGTWGSLLGIPLAYALNIPSKALALLSLTAFIFFAIWVSTQAESLWQEKDSRKIVIDEICGMSITLLFVPFTLKTVILAFLLFRFFDITKLSPINLLERSLPGGWGIVLDDVMAGVYARLCLQSLFYLGWL
ncbi:MAG: phosphatidylglycerophosphatase A [Deltaproteobacteria bacterium]|nr:phosphatidylglycerophosphatase A [Deltaproteobacteria bacterium]